MEWHRFQRTNELIELLCRLLSLLLGRFLSSQAGYLAARATLDTVCLAGVEVGTALVDLRVQAVELTQADTVGLGQLGASIRVSSYV